MVFGIGRPVWLLVMFMGGEHPDPDLKTKPAMSIYHDHFHV
jgi:hypothetical protein